VTLMTTAPLLRCRCTAYFHDDHDGRHAHLLVFGHQAAAEVEAAS
jgi:hypothetical protein